MSDNPTITVAELFAGVGGFRVGLEGYKDTANPSNSKPKAGPYKTIWANQWEPPGNDNKQFAYRCYDRHFPDNSCINKDIHQTIQEYEAGKIDIPDVDM